MEAIGIVRKIDGLGRLVIPREICHRMGINLGTPLQVIDAGDSIIIKKHEAPTMKEKVSDLVEVLNAGCGELENSEAIRKHLVELSKLLEQTDRNPGCGNSQGIR